MATKETAKFVIYHKSLPYNIIFSMPKDEYTCAAKAYQYLANKIGWTYNEVRDNLHVRKFSDILPNYTKNKPRKNLEEVILKLQTV